MSASVTTMKIAKTPSSTTTISDCARSTTPDPTRLTQASATTMIEVKMLSQAGPASSPTKSEVA